MVLFIAGCVSDDRMWYNRLNAVDAGRVSDSAIWAISKDHEVVQEIERLAAESEAYIHKRYSDDSQYETMPMDTRSYSYDDRNIDSHLHSALMDHYDSIKADNTFYSDSIVLSLDSLTLKARSGDPEALRQLAARHAIEGDINGLWSSDALMARDDSMRRQISDILARYARSDSAKAMLARLK